MMWTECCGYCVKEMPPSLRISACISIGWYGGALSEAIEYEKANGHKHHRWEEIIKLLVEQDEREESQ